MYDYPGQTRNASFAPHEGSMKRYNVLGERIKEFLQ
jgi:hypothetical protein